MIFPWVVLTPTPVPAPPPRPPMPRDGWVHITTPSGRQKVRWLERGRLWRSNRPRDRYERNDVGVPFGRYAKTCRIVPCTLLVCTMEDQA